MFSSVLGLELQDSERGEALKRERRSGSGRNGGGNALNRSDNGNAGRHRSGFVALEARLRDRG